jgi:hypothetical protein
VKRPEVERAAALGAEALRMTDGNPISSVKARAGELRKKLHAWA